MAIRTITQQDVKAVYKQRPAEVKKYDYGLMLVVGGSEFYSGAPALSALAGWRAGVDMVYVIAPKRAADIIASFTPILAAYPVDGDYLGSQHLSLLLARALAAKEEAKKLHTTIVLKAKTDIISNGEGVLLVEAGSPYLSIGGTGDTLAGIIGALLARKVDIMAAAAGGAYINSAAGELAGRKRKDSMIATDVIEEITNVIA